MQYTGKAYIRAGEIETYTVDYSADKDEGDTIVLTQAVITPNAAGAQIVNSGFQGDKAQFMLDAGSAKPVFYEVTVTTSWTSGRVNIDVIKVLVQ